MSQERQLAKARLIDQRNELKKLELQGESLLITLRQTLDPYAESIGDINTERAAQAMSDLHACAVQIRAALTKIRRLEADLNG